MKPRAAANQLVLALRAVLPVERWFPVDPLAVAREMGIHVHEEDLGVGMEGALLTKGRKSAIVINERIRDAGRRSFTGAHELGHYSLHRDRPELRCSVDDLLDTAPHSMNIEQEANEFAMTLLMPLDDVRQQAGMETPTIGLVKRLSGRYGTSLTATALRFRESSSQPFALFYVKAGLVGWCWPTGRFRWRMKRGQPWPSSLTPSDTVESVETEGLFGIEARARLGPLLRLSGADMPSYDAQLWVVETPDERRPWEWDRIEPNELGADAVVDQLARRRNRPGDL